MTTQFHDVRRHADGSIDIDFYRRKSAILRNQAKRHIMFKQIPAFARKVVIAAVAMFTIPAQAVAVSSAAAPAE